ncbi:MAG: TrmH family RNA methyltransferase [Marinilabiliaceae bacterium]
MLEKAQKKLITSLSQKKYRDKQGLFVAEGPKLVDDLLTSGMTPEILVSVHDDHFYPNLTDTSVFYPVDETEFKKISFLKTPQGVLGVFRKPSQTFHFGDHANDLTLCLDGIQDPGNMGTILRLADWFGIPFIVCSTDCADVFNPKVVQASMGALARVDVHYTPLAEFCTASSDQLHLPVFGTFMEGEDIFSTHLPDRGLIIMGNEGQGIRPETEETVTTRLSIPSFGTAHTGMESLNVAVATAIVCAEFRRQNAFTAGR